MGRQPGEVEGLYALAGPDVLDPLDREQELLLVAEPHDADVLEVLPGERRHVLDAAHALLVERAEVLLEPEEPQPLLERAGHVLRQPVAHVQVVDLGLQPLPVVRFLYTCARNSPRAQYVCVLAFPRSARTDVTRRAGMRGRVTLRAILETPAGYTFRAGCAGFD